MLCISIGYPELSVEREILKLHRAGEPVEQLQSLLEPSQLESLQQAARNVSVDDSINDYLLAIVTATREHPELTL